MEDQPADSGDLTPEDMPSPEVRPKARPVGKRVRGGAAATDELVEDTDAEAAEESVDEVTEESEAGQSEISEVATDSDETTDDEEATEDDESTVLVPFRPAGKRLTAVAAGAAVLFVASGAFAGAMLQPYLSDTALVEIKLQVAKTSADAITTLWTYTPDNIETLPDRAQKYLANDFANQYRTFIDSIVPTNKQAQISNNTQVMGTAVESISGNEATAIVYTNSVSTSPVTKNVPSLRYLSYRLTLKRDGGDWRITQMPALTQLDLSPQL